MILVSIRVHNYYTSLYSNYKNLLLNIKLKTKVIYYIYKDILKAKSTITETSKLGFNMGLTWVYYPYVISFFIHIYIQYSKHELRANSNNIR